MAGMQALNGINGAKTATSSSQYDAKSAALNAAGNAANLRAQGASTAANARINAINYDAQADYYLRAARNAQMAGRDERAQRGLQLGQDKGRIMAEAAGSGIDTSSRVVTKTLRDTVKSAYHDLAMSGRNEYQNVYGAMKNRAVANLNAANQRRIASWASEAYEKLAGQVENAGAITAQSYLSAGRSQAQSAIFGGIMSAAGLMAKDGGVSVYNAPTANYAGDSSNPNTPGAVNALDSLKYAQRGLME